MASQLVGVKRKGEDLEQYQHQKKPKISQELIYLPEDCWKAIFEYLTFEAASSLYYASKSFRHVHSRLVAHYCNRVHGLPMDLAPLLPKSVIKRISNIDGILLFEKAISLAEEKDYEGLARVLKNIQLLAEMDQIIFIVLNTVPKNLIEDKHLKSVYYYDFYRNIQEIFEDTVEQTAEVIQRSKFIWIGKDRRYIDVNCQYHDLLINAPDEEIDLQGWLDVKVTLVLKQLGAENGSDEKIVFEFKKDPSDENTKGHTIEQCIFEEDSYEKRGLFDEDDIRKVMEWLKVDLIDNENPPKTFMKVLLNLAENQKMIIFREVGGQAIDYENIKFNLYEDECLQPEELEELTNKYNEEIEEFKGDIEKEVSHLMRFYLSGNNNWNAKTRFVVKRLLLKLGFIFSITKTDFSSEKTKEELMDLFERATMESCESREANIQIPKTAINVPAEALFIDKELQLKLLPKDGLPTQLKLGIFFQFSPQNNDGSSFSFAFSQNSNWEQELKCSNSGQLKNRFAKTFAVLLEKMNLKHVTTNDWLEFLLKFTNMAYLQYYDGSSSSSSDEEFEEDGENGPPVL